MGDQQLGAFPVHLGLSEDRENMPGFVSDRPFCNLLQSSDQEFNDLCIIAVRDHMQDNSSLPMND